MNDLSLIIDGANYSGWESIDITISMDTLSGVFNIGMSDKISNTTKPVLQSPTVKPLQSCEVSLGGETVITGFVDKVTPQISKDTHTIFVSGRDKSGDLVDCSMIDSISQWKNLKLEQIITRICDPFGIPVTADVDTGKAFDTFVIEQGATCLEAIQKLCFARQTLAISDGKGGLLLTQAGTEEATTSIIEGQNLREGNAVYDASQRFSMYICKGQKQGDDNSSPESVASNSGSDTDTVIDRYRPFMIIFDGQATIADCAQRAKWEAAIRRGKSISINITVNRWTQEDGTLWGINKIVYVKSQRLGVDASMLISSVNFKLDDNGELTVLTLTSPEAYVINSEKFLTSSGDEKSNQYLTKRNP